RHPAIRTFVSETMEQGTELLIVRRHDSAITACDMLGRLERETGDMTDCSDGFTSIKRAPGLCAVLDEDEIMLVRERFEFVRCGRVTTEMDGDDRLRFGRDQRFNRSRADLICMRLKVREYRHRLLEQDPNNGSNVCKAGRNDFVAGSDPG